MSNTQLADWAGVGLAAISIGLTLALYVLQNRKTDRLQSEQRVNAAELAAGRLVTRWTTSLLSTQSAYVDPLIEGLIESAKRWRHEAAADQAEIRHALPGESSLPYRLVDEAVAALVQFETEAVRIMEGAVNRNGYLEDDRKPDLERALRTLHGRMDETIRRLREMRPSDFTTVAQPTDVAGP